MRKRTKIAVAALAVAVLSPAVVPAQAGRTVKRSVEVGDYYYTPETMTVRRNTIVVWKWPEGGGDGHDVALKKGPRGVKKFRSDVLFADESYRKRLKVRGRYSIYCTLHPDDMKQTIRVK